MVYILFIVNIAKILLWIFWQIFEIISKNIASPSDFIKIASFNVNILTLFSIFITFVYIALITIKVLVN